MISNTVVQHSNIPEHAQHTPFITQVNGEASFQFALIPALHLHAAFTLFAKCVVVEIEDKSPAFFWHCICIPGIIVKVFFYLYTVFTSFLFSVQVITCFMQRFTLRVYVCLAATCHLYFWLRSFTCYCCNMQAEWTPKQESAHKVSCGDQNSAWDQTHDLPMTTPTLHHCTQIVQTGLLCSQTVHQHIVNAHVPGICPLCSWCMQLCISLYWMFMYTDCVPAEWGTTLHQHAVNDHIPQICTLFLIYATLRQHVVNDHVPQICTLFLMYANLHQHIVNNHAPRLCPPWSCRMKDNSVCMQLCINMQLAPLWLKDTKCQRCRCQPWQPATRCLVSTQHTASSASLQEDVSEQKSYYAHQLRFSLVCSLYSFPFDTGYVY